VRPEFIALPCGDTRILCAVGPAVTRGPALQRIVSRDRYQSSPATADLAIADSVELRPIAGFSCADRSFAEKKKAG
jgi:hypothetical protein